MEILDTVNSIYLLQELLRVAARIQACARSCISLNIKIVIFCHPYILEVIQYEWLFCLIAKPVNKVIFWILCLAESNQD